MLTRREPGELGTRPSKPASNGGLVISAHKAPDHQAQTVLPSRHVEIPNGRPN